MTAASAVLRPLQQVGRLPLFAPLAGRDYRLTWFGQGVSLLGDHFHFIALSWLVLGLTGSGAALGIVMIAFAIPRGVFMLLGGVFADRLPPRSIVLASDIARGLITASIAILIAGDAITLPILLVLGVGFGTVDALFIPAIGTLVARLVPEERLAAANALMRGTADLIGTIGPAIAGLTVAAVGVGAAFALDAVSFAVAAVALWLVRTTGVAPSTAAEPTAASGPAAEERPSIRAALVDGARAVMSDPALRMLMILSLVFNLAMNGPITIGLPWLVLVREGDDPSALGLLFAAYGVGAFVGAVVAGSLPRPAAFGWVVLALAACLGVLVAAIGLVDSLLAVGVILIAFGLINGYVNIVIIAWVQARTDPTMLGRAMSFVMLGSVVAAPISLALAGILVDIDAQAMFVAAGLLVIATAAAGILSGVPRAMR